jgi:hypothetical protein
LSTFITAATTASAAAAATATSTWGQIITMLVTWML